MEYHEIIDRLKTMGSEPDREGMARFGIDIDAALGISVRDLRALAKEIGTDHDLALQLWDSGIHEARLLATFIDDPDEVGGEQMERWVHDISSWDLCDQASVLFAKTSEAQDKVFSWSAHPEEFVKRAAFAMMVNLAKQNREMDDADFEQFLLRIVEGASDDRNFVRKGISWALREIGKRSLYLNVRAIEVSRELKASPDKAERWVGSDAYRELTSDKVQERIRGLRA